MVAHKGHVKAGGRALGTLNHATVEIKELARVHGPAGIAKLAELAFDAAPSEEQAIEKIVQMHREGRKMGDIAKYARSAFQLRSEQTCVAAIKELFDRGYGRPPQPHDGDGHGGPIVVNVITGVRG